MHKRTSAWLLPVFLLLFVVLTGGARMTRADDGMFPPAAAARPFIDFDGKGFIVHGRRTFIASGSLHYPRVPRALWRDRLLRFKRAGFNTVQTYAFWNFHEPQEGKFDFTGDKDLDAFLKLVKSLGMYATVRVGPYVCAEWDSGGYPVWLRFKPGVRVREDNPQFEKYMDRWLDHVMPIVAANQINRGGSVIMVQLENEHPQGWGREMPNGYFTHLRDKALSLGLEVPYFFSGLNHGSDPAGGKPWDSVGRTNPWYSTEFWSVWYDRYGARPSDLVYDRRTWKILAYGGNGYNFYMLHGGTNFASWNNDEDTSSYDYGAAVGQAGDLRPIYYRFKRVSWFARAFQDILENSTNATDAFKNAATNSAVRVTARQSPAGTILFLDNNTDAPLDTQVKLADGKTYPHGGQITLMPGEIMPIVMDAPIIPGVKLTLGAARILGIAHQGATTTMVVYGPAGSKGQLNFHAGATDQVIPVTFPEGSGVMQSRVTAGGAETVRVMAVSDAAADKTWFVDAGTQTYIVCGADYVGDASAPNGRLTLTTEAPWTALSKPAVMAYGADDAPLLLRAQAVLNANITAPVLVGWQMRTATAEAQNGYRTTAWKTSGVPLAMGADGDYSEYAWYRANVQAPRTGLFALNVARAGDWLMAFVNGKPAGSTKPKQGTGARTLTLPLRSGPNSVAIFAAHYGRPKLFGYLGPIDTIDVKGMAGDVTLAKPSQNDGTKVTQWQWKTATGTETSGPETVSLSADAWQDTQIGTDVFGKKSGFAWYRAVLSASTAAHHSVHFEDVDDTATIYLNGKRLARHEGWGQPFDVSLDSRWQTNGPNELAVLVENNDNTGGINGAVTLQEAATGATPVTGWAMHGGIGAPDAANARWQPVTPQGTGAPTFFRCRFTAQPPGATGPHPILRVTTTGLSRGFVSLNGHNLGRYPEKVAASGLYLPECWLKPGTNSLAFFDEEGHVPTQVKLVIEDTASRVAVAQEAK